MLKSALMVEENQHLTLNFLNMIIDKRRETYIGLISEEYRDMADELRNITKAELTAAAPVSEADMKNLEQNLSAKTGKTVQLSLKVDPGLIGGLKIRIGDQIVDATVAKKLEMLKEQLKQAKIS